MALSFFLRVLVTTALPTAVGDCIHKTTDFSRSAVLQFLEQHTLLPVRSGVLYLYTAVSYSGRCCTAVVCCTAKHTQSLDTVCVRVFQLPAETSEYRPGDRVCVRAFSVTENSQQTTTTHSWVCPLTLLSCRSLGDQSHFLSFFSLTHYYCRTTC